MENRTEPKHAGTGLEGQDRTFSSGVIGPSHVSMRLLDPGNATELGQFEQAFFRGFRQASHKLRIPHDSARQSEHGDAEITASTDGPVWLELASR
jgi:hypothetical protein